MKFANVFPRVFLAIVLAMSLTTLPAFAEDGATAGEQWVNDIDAMLAWGDYIEGEAIVGFYETDGNDVMTAQSTAPYTVEPLMEVASSTVEPQVESTPVLDGVVLAAQSAGKSACVQISLVSSDSLSTEELLRQLAEDPSVAFAEPNYIGKCLDVDDSLTAASSDYFGNILKAQATNEAADLTQLQWGNSEKGSHFDGSGNTSINVPGFVEQDKSANMTNQVVVAVVDHVVDTTNPDIQPSLVQFTVEQQKALGCGEWGYNATAESADGVPDALMQGYSSHGTHVTGVIGAQWDGHGISGVASNVKIVSIENHNENGLTSLGNNVRAYAFIKRYNESVDDRMRVKAVNNSWGLYQYSRAWNAAVTELGEKYGTITVQAAGNDGKDNDLTESFSNTLADNPYAIIVAATDPSGTLTDFSQWGERTVTLAAPGSNILSTCNTTQMQYIPDASLDTNLCYEGFEGPGEPQVWLLDDAGEKVRQATRDSDVRMSGNAGATIALDAQGSGESTVVVMVEIPLTDAVKAEMKAADSRLYFGVGVEASKATNGCYVAGVMMNVLSGSAESIPVSNSDIAGGNWVGNIAVNSSTRSANLRELLDETKLEDATELKVQLFVRLMGPCTALHIDSIGIGSQIVPYMYSCGTSQAAPAVTGAVAVLASQSGLSGAELASLVRSKVRIPESGPLPVRTGGVFDFAVDGSTETKALSPAIAGVSVNDTMVTITGKNFGSAPGSVELSRYVVGKDNAAAQATVSSWADDKVVLQLASSFTGIMRAQLINVDGKQDVAYRFISKGKDVYEQDLPFYAGTGNPFEIDSWGDFETEGPLVGLGCKLYYLPVIQQVEQVPATKRMLCFDLKTETWTELPALPEWLMGVSAVMHDGKIVVEGSTTYALLDGEPTDVFPEGEAAEERVYVYDPASGAWSQASNAGMHVGQTIVNDNGQLELVGGEAEPAERDEQGQSVPAKGYAFTLYDLSTGAGDAFCTPPVAYKNPQAVAKDGVLYLYDPYGVGFMRVQKGAAEMMDEALPEFLFAQEGEPAGNFPNDPYVSQAVLTVASDGIVLVGPPAKDGSSDTFILKNGEDKFASYAKRASDARVFSIAAATYRGRLFVIGSSSFEPNERLFRATAMSVPEYPGDIPCDDTPVTPTNPTDTSAKTTAATAKTGDELPPWLLLALVGCAVAAGLLAVRARSRT